MSSGRGSHRDPDDDLDDDDATEDEEERPARRPKRRSSKSGAHGSSRPVHRWKASKDDEEEDEEVVGVAEKRPIYWRARDSLYFEPLVALAIVVVLIVALFAYTQNWPPVYVVESDSMQHGSSDVLGVINTGDLVLAQKISNSSITPYVVGMQTAFSTYGEYGDVLLYHPDGGSGTPVIHRAILFLAWNPSSRSYSANDLQGLPCGNASHAVYATPGTPGACGTSGLTGTLDLFGLGWKSVSVSLDLSAPALGQHSGYLTMGDNNYYCGGNGACTGEPDQGGTNVPVISTLVEPAWVVGVARGMIPWFGAFKLLLDGQASMVPPQSWQYLGLTVVGLLALAFGIHYAFRREGIESPLRKEEDEARAQEVAASAEETSDEPRSRRWLASLRPWHRSEEDEPEPASPPGKHVGSKSPKKNASSHRGRPRPNVEREARTRHSADDDDEL